MIRPVVRLALLFCCASPALLAQERQASRFAIADAPRAIAPMRAIAPVTVGGQMLAGIGGFVGGALVVGIASGAVGYVASGGEQKNMRGAFAYGAIAGALAGPTVGVQWYGRRHGLRSSVLSTAIGSAIGLLPVPLAPITMPLGATIGYNRARRARTP